MKTADDILSEGGIISVHSHRHILGAEIGHLREEVRRLQTDNAQLQRNTTESEAKTQVIRDKLNGFMRAYRDDTNRLQAENERLRKDAERGKFLIEHGEWFRHNHDTPHAYALLAVRLPYTADLSCKAMREDAIDAARSAKTLPEPAP